MNKDVIIACDFSSAAETFAFLDRFAAESRKPFLKIGMELYYAEGPQMVRELKRRGHPIFLDLKLHDIPNTVRKTMRVLSSLDIDLCNVHAAGTIEMMQAAREGLTRPDGSRPLLIAVTQLTSTSQERMQKELLIGKAIDETIIHYARNAREAGLDPAWSRKPAVRTSSPSRPASASPMPRRTTRSASPHPPVRVRSDPTSSSLAVPSRPLPTRSPPGGAA